MAGIRKIEDFITSALRFIRKVRRKFTVVAVVVLAICGCMEQKQIPDPKAAARPYAGQEVELLVPLSLSLQAVWEVELQEWMTQTGATIRWNEYASSDEDELAMKLALPAPSGGRLVLFPLSRLSDLETHLAPLDTGRIADFEPKDILRGLRERIVSRDRSVVALPISAPLLVCYYRADLLRSAGLKAPGTWEEYQSLLDTLEQWAPNLTAVEPLGLDNRAATFFARTLAYAKHPENYSVWFELDTGKPIIESAGFIQATEMARRAWKKMPASIVNLSPLDCRREVLEGRAALAIGIEPMISPNPLGISRPAGIELGVCPLPGSHRVFNRYSNRWDALPADSSNAPGLCATAGQALGVTLPSKGTKDVAAWHLLSRLAVDRFESSWAALPKTPCRESQVSFAASWHETGLTVEESSQHVDSIARTLRSTQLVADFPILAAAEFRRATTEWLGKLLESPDLESGAAIKELQDSFEQITAKVGTETLRSTYRRGLGLPNLDGGPRSASGGP